MESSQAREVYAEGGDPFSTYCYTIPEMARALDRSSLTIKRWIKEGVLPPPVLKDTSRKYSQYAEEEVRLIAECLILHEQEYTYLSPSHEATVQRIYSVLRAYREREGWTL